MRHINSKELTARSFITRAFNKETIYCTGDVARYWADGNLEFIGRVDNQIKINGYRVELGEIESALLENDSITSACAMVVRNTIIAVITAKNNILQEDVLAVIKDKLPEYFMPKSIKVWESIPLTTNGKVDRKKIAEVLENSELFEEKRDEPVVGAMEKAIAEVWKEVLGLKTLSRNDDFFEKGGDSLKAMAVVNELNNKRLSDTKISLALLFSNSTPKRLAAVLEKNKMQWI